MDSSSDRNQEVKKRVLEWEATNNKKLEKCTRDEWLEAMQTIKCLTQTEAEKYLDHLLQQRHEL
ncbi:hypothetical protein BRDCF_p2045 [Bacteroidales bacterium CF]|jgi:hypothetical protein|nr:hypothetical protein BRDCF_p2045 [Bacteroidales bacterium CF]